MFADSIRDLLRFHAITLCEQYNLSPHTVGILSIDITFLQCDIAQGMIFKGKGNDIIHNFTIDVDPGYKYIEKICGGVQWYLTGSKDIISSTSFKQKMKIIN